MKRILTWHFEDVRGSGERVGAAYYVEADYTPVAVRIHAYKAPDYDDAEFEILKDGTSIMNNRGSGVTTVALTKGSTSAEAADDFKNETIESGTWLTCTLGKDGGGKNFTIQMEMSQVSTEDESEE